MRLRAQQHEIVAGYRGGKLAIAAVPGSGKTQTLAALAAHLLSQGLVGPESEVLVVTFTNSAVENVRARIRAMLRAAGSDATGFRVLTLHSLANAIVRERPDLAGLAYDYRVDDELSSERTLLDAAEQVIQHEGARWRALIADGLTPQQRAEAEARWREDVMRLGREVIDVSKNLRLTPEALLAACAGERGTSPCSPFLQIGAAIYARYDSAMRATGRLDFDDLLWAAVRALNNDDDFSRRLGQRWPFILEDEAQDSTPLQELMLELLSRDHGNWVRVGDPNQAIMTTFTASDVRLFRRFMQRPEVKVMPLSVSGRSAPPIIKLANALVRWARREHPEPWVREHALSDDVLIHPTSPDDPQQNPAEGDIRVRGFQDEADEIEAVAKGAVDYVLRHPDRTCAILAPTNAAGQRVAQALQKLQARYPDKVLYQDQLRNPQPVRRVAQALACALRFCSQPARLDLLAGVHTALDQRLDKARMRRLETLLRSAQPEALLFPASDGQPALPPNLSPDAEEWATLRTWASHAAEWLRASLLPVDQLVLAIAQQLFSADAELAIAHSLAASLRRYMLTHPQAQLADAARELGAIAENRRRYPSNFLADAGFQPAPGQVTVTTMHKAKGLEWDRVYLISVDEVEFPHSAEGGFRGQRWYLDGRDPALEARTQIEALAGQRDAHRDLIREARLEYIAERLRLLYVGITRARRDLRISFSRQRVNLALAVRALNSA